MGDLMGPSNSVETLPREKTASEGDAPERENGERRKRYRKMVKGSAKSQCCSTLDEGLGENPQPLYGEGSAKSQCCHSKMDEGLGENPSELIVRRAKCQANSREGRSSKFTLAKR
jgi:hypothetical protein